MRWNSKNKSRYEGLGYTYTKMKDPFMVRVEDLPHGSKALVRIKCDYCGVEFMRKWYLQISAGECGIDACFDCKHLKAKETLKVRYCVDNCALVAGSQEKQKQTLLKRYGVENIFSSEETKEAIKRTMLQKYGKGSYTQTEEYLEKRAATCMKKYGVDNPGKIRPLRGADSPVWKGGAAVHRQERSTYEYAEWRRGVFVAHKYTCERCGRTGVMLNAHHICNWKDYPDLRYDVGNGGCLCDVCHQDFHRAYGKSNNTQKQYNEFLNTEKKIC